MGLSFWVSNNSGDAVFKYDSIGNYTGASFSVASQGTNPRDITWDGVSLWTVDVTNDMSYQYEIPSVPDVIVETSTGECIDDAVISFTQPCTINQNEVLPCG